jgi:hypothetical protein
MAETTHDPNAELRAWCERVEGLLGIASGDWGRARGLGPPPVAGVNPSLAAELLGGLWKRCGYSESQAPPWKEKAEILAHHIRLVPAAALEFLHALLLPGLTRALEAGGDSSWYFATAGLDVRLVDPLLAPASWGNEFLPTAVVPYASLPANHPLTRQPGGLTERDCWRHGGPVVVLGPARPRFDRLGNPAGAGPLPFYEVSAVTARTRAARLPQSMAELEREQAEAAERRRVEQARAKAPVSASEMAELRRRLAAVEGK